MLKSDLQYLFLVQPLCFVTLSHLRRVECDTKVVFPANAVVVAAEKSILSSQECVQLKAKCVVHFSSWLVWCSFSCLLGIIKDHALLGTTSFYRPYNEQSSHCQFHNGATLQLQLYDLFAAGVSATSTKSSSTPPPSITFVAAFVETLTHCPTKEIWSLYQSTSRYYGHKIKPHNVQNKITTNKGQYSVWPPSKPNNSNCLRT